MAHLASLDTRALVNGELARLDICCNMPPTCTLIYQVQVHDCVYTFHIGSYTHLVFQCLDNRVWTGWAISTLRSVHGGHTLTVHYTYTHKNAKCTADEMGREVGIE